MTMTTVQKMDSAAPRLASLPREVTIMIFKHVWTDNTDLKDKLSFLKNLLLKKRDLLCAKLTPMLSTMIDGTKFSAWRTIHFQFYNLSNFMGGRNGNSLFFERINSKDRFETTLSWQDQERTWLDEPAVFLMTFMPLDTQQFVLCVLIEFVEKQLRNDLQSFPSALQQMIKLDPLTPAIFYLHWDHEDIVYVLKNVGLQTLFYTSWNREYEKSQECDRLLWNIHAIEHDLWVMQSYMQTHEEFQTGAWKHLWPEHIKIGLESAIERCKQDTSQCLLRHPCLVRNYCCGRWPSPDTAVSFLKF